MTTAAAVLGACAANPEPAAGGGATGAGRSAVPGPSTAASTDAAPAATTTAVPTTTTVAVPATAPRPSDERPLTLVRTVTGDISPKSVVANGAGIQTAQNMMYRHTVTLYDAAGELIATVPDTVDLADWGFPDRAGVTRGGPVEAAPSPDGRFMYVSNYSLTGPGAGKFGDDVCSPDSGVGDSLVYRIDLARAAIDAVYPVGAVPKYLAVTPDGSTLLVSNWCSYDLSVVDLTTGAERARPRVGRYPRGLAVAPDGRTAYIAAMGTTTVKVFDIASARVVDELTVGRGPRHLVLSPDGRMLYVTLNAEGTVAKLDLGNGNVVGRVTTGQAPRSMAMAEDGRTLYVVNYKSDTLSVVRTSDMEELAELPTRADPIGVTYEPTTDTVWVASYKGALQLFALG